MLSRFWLILAIAGVLATASGFAEEPVVTAVKAITSGPSDPPSQRISRPACLEELNLAPRQRAQIRAIVVDYDADIAAVEAIEHRYLETIRTEAILLSAIEDNLTEPQREQVRDQRRRVAQHEKAISRTSIKANQETAKPVSAVEGERSIIGVPLTPEQEATADAIQEKYLSTLRSSNRSIQGLHNRLVSLESDKFVEIEKILTEEQLKQLRRFAGRHRPPRRVRHSASATRRCPDEASVLAAGRTAPCHGHPHPQPMKGPDRETHRSLVGISRRDCPGGRAAILDAHGKRPCRCPGNGLLQPLRPRPLRRAQSGRRHCDSHLWQ